MLSALAKGVLVGIVALGASCASAVPKVVRDELARTPAGTVTVVFFTDFQCPFCRRTHAALSAALATRHAAVRVVVRHVPLRMHPDARTAARAAICGEMLGARGDLIDALYRAPDLGEGAVLEMVVERGVERAKYEACAFDPATDARIEGDIAMLDALGGDGVPLLYIGSQRLDGSQTRQSLEVALEAAHRELPR